MRACPACGSPEHRKVLLEGEFILVRCRRCALVYLGNPPHIDTLYDEYHAGSEPVDPADYGPHSAHPSLAELWCINGQRLDWIERRAPKGPLLDVGCGKGFFVLSASERGFRAHGIDVSDPAVRFATETLGLDVSTDALKDLVAAGRSYAVITMWHVLEHFDDPLPELGAAHALLQPGGLLVLEVPNFHSPAFRLPKPRWQGGNHPRYHRTFFTRRTLPALLGRAGFSSAGRIRMDYRLRSTGPARAFLKCLLNVLALDSSLDYYARK